MRLLAIWAYFLSIVYAASQFQEAPLRYKVVVVGQSGVGKSSLTIRFSKGAFFDRLETTMGASFVTKMWEIDGRVVRFEVWDTAGQERYNSLIPLYYRGARAALVVYDLTDRVSYERAQKWVRELSGERSIGLIALFGNKLDLEGERQVSNQEASQFAEDEGLLFVEGSAYSGQQVEEVFNDLARSLIKGEVALVKQMAEGGGSELPAGLSRENSDILILHHQKEQQQQIAATSRRSGYCCYW